MQKELTQTLRRLVECKKGPPASNKPRVRANVWPVAKDNITAVEAATLAPPNSRLYEDKYND